MNQHQFPKIYIITAINTVDTAAEYVGSFKVKRFLCTHFWLAIMNNKIELIIHRILRGNVTCNQHSIIMPLGLTAQKDVLCLL